MTKRPVTEGNILPMRRDSVNIPPVFVSRHRSWAAFIHISPIFTGFNIRASMIILGNKHRKEFEIMSDFEFSLWTVGKLDVSNING